MQGGRAAKRGTEPSTGFSYQLFPLDQGLILPCFDGAFHSGMLARRGASKLGRTRSTWITVTRTLLDYGLLGEVVKPATF